MVSLIVLMYILLHIDVIVFFIKGKQSGNKFSQLRFGHPPMSDGNKIFHTPKVQKNSQILSRIIQHSYV